MEGRSRGLIKDRISVFSWKDWEKSQKKPVKIAGLRVEIRNRDLLKTLQDC
jgi:hypothetical protein